MGCGSSSSSTKVNTSKPETKYKTSSGNTDDEKQAARKKNAEYISTLTALAKVPLLKRLPKDQHPMLAACCVTQVFHPGDTVIKQGELGQEFFVIRSGEATVLVNSESGPMKVATVKAGDYFGENALLHDEPRNATIKAETQLECLKVTRDKFQELKLHLHLEFGKRKAVVGTVSVKESHPLWLHPPTKKTPEEVQFIVDNLAKNKNIQTIASADTDRLRTLADVSWRQEIAEGEKVIEQGDDKADFFYVVEKGSFDVLIAEAVEPEANAGTGSVEVESMETTRKSMSFGPAQKVLTLEAGGSFGELALLYSVPRAATVQARENSSVWVFDRANFKRMLMKASDAKIDEYVNLLEGVEVFTALLMDEKRSVAEALSEMSFQKDDVVLKQGEPGDTFYILYEGDVEVTKDGKVVQTLNTNVEKRVAHYFGERALINNEPRAATVKVTSDVAKALVLDKVCFDLLLGSVREFMKDRRTSKGGTPGVPLAQYMQEKGSSSRSKPTPAARTGVDEAVLLEDLDLVGTLGVGAFGKVELREHKVTGKTYAVKMMSKGYVAKMRMQNNVVNEKHILASVDSPFIIKLYNTSHSAQWIYFFMEPALGGELYVVYHRKCFHGSLPHARYYTASVVGAFEHLHERHVIYRDLKPENLLLTSEGYLKLTDMGLAKFALGKTYTTCGTPEYFAPEVIRSTGQTRAVDWWTLGILIFELMTGSAPFRAENDMAMYGKVLKGIHHISFPSKAEGATEDLVKAILKADPSERLPMRHGGVANLKNHAWFKGLDWPGLENRTVQPPFQPAVKSATDLRNFCHVKVHKANWIEWKDDGSGWDKDF